MVFHELPVYLHLAMASLGKSPCHRACKPREAKKILASRAENPLPAPLTGKGDQTTIRRGLGLERGSLWGQRRGSPETRTSRREHMNRPYSTAVLVTAVIAFCAATSFAQVT